MSGLAALLAAASLAACASDDTRQPQSIPPAPLPPHDRFFVVDCDAEQEGVEGFPGAVYSFDRADASCVRFAADPRFDDPYLLLVHPDGTLVLVDHAASADPKREGGKGAVFRLDGTTGKVLRVYAPSCFAGPVSATLQDARTLLVCDRRAQVEGCSGTGAIFRLDLESGDCERLAADARFAAPADVLMDGSGVLMLDADAVADAATGAQGVLFRVDFATRAVAEIAKLPQALSPLGLLAEKSGDLLIFDANADPLKIGGPVGAIFRLHRSEARCELVASLPRFRDPVRGCLLDDGGVLFVDANADPDKKGPDKAHRGQNLTGPGAIFRLDPKTGDVTLVAAPPEFVNPVDILRRP